MSQSVDVVIPVYNAADPVCDTVRHISQQQLPDGWQLNIYVSDDGSTDDTQTKLQELKASVPALHVIRADSNGGRSQACNNGVRAGSGPVIVICDADCRYTRADAIAQFLDEIERGADAVIGLIELSGDGFWARYTNSVAAERLTNQVSRGLMSYSTGNFAIRRSAYAALQGYSLDYARYGFEDKDLLIRMEQMSLDVRVRQDISVNHDDDFRLATVCRKSEESGRHSAQVFRSRFPDEYRKLPYARCDATLDNGMRLLKPVSSPLKHVTRLFAATVLLLPLPGFRLQRFAVRVAICAAYFHGTASNSKGDDLKDRSRNPE